MAAKSFVVLQAVGLAGHSIKTALQSLKDGRRDGLAAKTATINSGVQKLQRGPVCNAGVPNGRRLPPVKPVATSAMVIKSSRVRGRAKPSGASNLQVDRNARVVGNILRQMKPIPIVRKATLLNSGLKAEKV